MKLLAIAGSIACPLAIFVIAFLLGMGYAVRSEVAKAARQAGLTKDGAKLLGEAARLLNSLVNLTELDGEFGATRLSDKDTQRVKEWVDRYRKETTKA